jgi:pimeloyl-ACP methyl ester carboxylesterase
MRSGSRARTPRVSGWLLSMTTLARVDAAEPPSWFTTALATVPDYGTTVVEGTTIAYRAWGERTEQGIVLLHGGAAHSGWWDHIGPLLARSRRVVALDLSGHGDSEHRDIYSLDLWAHEALAAAHDAGISGPLTVIGHSMGGFVTLRAASLFASAIAGAVLIDSAVRDITLEERAARERRAFGPLRRYPTREAAVARFHPVPDQPTLPYITAHVAASSARRVTGGWSWKFDPRIFARPHFAPQSLTRLDCRVAVLRGEHGMVSQQIGKMMYDRLGRAPVIEIPAAGHHIMLDQPIALVTAIRTLFSEWDHFVLPHGR